MPLTQSTVAMMLPVTDTDRAKTFYTEKLGLDYTGTNEEGSADVRPRRRSDAGAAPPPRQHTVREHRR